MFKVFGITVIGNSTDDRTGLQLFGNLGQVRGLIELVSATTKFIDCAKIYRNFIEVAWFVK
ncbi:hypothetical protein D3C80_1108400 [compost metagenome]